MENVSLRTVVLFTYTRGKRGIMLSGTCFLTLFLKRNKKIDRGVFKKFIMCISTNVSVLSLLPSNNEKLRKKHNSTNAVAFRNPFPIGNIPNLLQILHKGSVIIYQLGGLGNFRGDDENNSTPNGGGVKISFMNPWGRGGSQI